MSKVMSKEDTFIAKVKAVLNLDDESKSRKFYNVTLKVWYKQIDIDKAEILDNEERIEEITDEKLYDSIYKLDMNKINNTDSRKSYVQEYQNGIIAVRDEIKELKEYNEQLKERIADFNYLISLI